MTIIATILSMGSEQMEKDEVTKKILAQSSIPLEIRRTLAQQVSKPRVRSQLKSSLFLQK